MSAHFIRASERDNRASDPNKHTNTAMATQAPYIPSKEADLINWGANFSALLTATPATYGQTAPVALTVQTAFDTYQASYDTATNPGTRTSPAVAQKDADRAAFLAVVRPVAQQISKSEAVTPENKTAIGVNLPNFSPTPIPPPATFPQLSLDGLFPGTANLRYQDSGLGTGKRKPQGAISVEIFQTVGQAPAVDPDAAHYVGSYTKAPFTMSFSPTQVGKTATIWGRWRTRSGSAGESFVGPWSPALSFVVA